MSEGPNVLGADVWGWLSGDTLDDCWGDRSA